VINVLRYTVPPLPPISAIWEKNIKYRMTEKGRGLKKKE
jgi:hypothetical protein